MAGLSRCRFRGEGRVERAQNIFGSLIDFVAELPVAVHDFDVEVDVTP